MSSCDTGRALELVNAHAPPGETLQGSPTHVASQYRPSVYQMHARQDSETVLAASPTAVDSGSGSGDGLPEKPGHRGGYASKHRKSPPAPEHQPQIHDRERDRDGFAIPAAPWSVDDRDRERGRRTPSDEHQPYLSHMNGYQPQVSHQSQAMAPRLQSTSSMPNVNSMPAPSQQSQDGIVPGPQTVGKNAQLIVNKKTYARLELIGKGGTSKVYRVMNGYNEVYAMKRVALDRTDQDAMSGYMNEIALLKRLDGNKRIIKLVDSEVRSGTNGPKGYLTLIMELGEIGKRLCLLYMP